MKLPKDKYKLAVISVVLYLVWGLIDDWIFTASLYKFCIGIDGDQILSESQCDLLESFTTWVPNIGFGLSMFYVWSSRFRNLFNRNKITKSKDD